MSQQHRDHQIQYMKLNFEAAEDDFAVSEMVTRMSTIVAKLVYEDKNNPLNSVFVIGESLCSEKDNFCKEIGKDIALERIKNFRISGGLSERGRPSSRVYELTLADLNMVDADDLPVAMAPLSGVPLKWGFITRLIHLMETECGEAVQVYRDAA